MKEVKIILACMLATCNYIYVDAQITSANQLHCSRGYFGGFEAGSSNISKDGAGTDYRYILPNMGGFSIVKNALEAKMIAVINKAPRSGNFMMVAHNRAIDNKTIWWKVLPVEPGETYQFGAYITILSKNSHKGSVQLKVNDSTIATAGLTDTWGNIHGQFTAPPNVTSLKISIAGEGAIQHGHYMGIDDIYVGRVDEKMFDKEYENSVACLAKPLKQAAPSQIVAAKMPVKIKRKLPGVTSSAVRVSSKRPVVTVYPNPARDYFVINIKSIVFGKATVRILNEHGKIVLTRDAHVSVGLNTITISNRKNILGGNYTVRVISGGDICNHDLVVL